MQMSVTGIYQNGQVQLAEPVTNHYEGMQVIVTFVESDQIVPESYGIDPAQAETLQASLATFADDWNSPEMSIYDDYDAAIYSLQG